MFIDLTHFVAITNPQCKRPSATTIPCQRCHEPSMHSMMVKFGLNKACADCHPFHQNSIHHETYVKPVAKTTLD